MSQDTKLYSNYLLVGKPVASTTNRDHEPQADASKRDAGAAANPGAENAMDGADMRPAMPVFSELERYSCCRFIGLRLFILSSLILSSVENCVHLMPTDRALKQAGAA